MVCRLHWPCRMDRALRIVRLTLESSGDVGMAVSASLVALQFVWMRWGRR